MMQDKKALQAGTSHFLGQNFAKASNIKFQSREGNEELAWTTSWGVTTRLIGALIMAHSDDNGLVLPPEISPLHLVIVPIYRTEEDKKTVLDFIESLTENISKQRYNDEKIRYKIDDRDIRGGEKIWEWIKKGVPIRLEIGPRDVQNNSVFIGRRDKQSNEKKSMNINDFTNDLSSILDDIQNNIYEKALKFQHENTLKIDDREKFYKYFTPKDSENPEIHGGFALSHWCGKNKCEQKIKDDLKVTIRCIPNDAEFEKGKCINCGEESDRRVIFAKAY